MAKFRSIRNSLLGGEISATALGRTDLPQYPHSCKLMRNVIPLVSGGGYRRPGTFYVTSIDASAYYAPWLFPYYGATTYGFCGAVYSPQSANPCKLGTYEPTYAFGTNLGSFDATGALASGLAPVSTPPTTPLRPEDYYDPLLQSHYVQIGDVTLIVNRAFLPQRYAAGAFQDFDTGLTGTSQRDCRPYLPQNTDAGNTLQPGATTGSNQTLTASSAFFDSGHVGAYFKINHGGTIGCMKITSITSTTVARGDIVVDFGATTAVTTWWESAWSTFRGFPGSIAVFYNRVAFGGTKYRPDDIHFTKDSNYRVMSVAATTDPFGETDSLGPFTTELPALQAARINTMSGGKSLFVGTDVGAYLIQPETGTAGLEFSAAYHQISQESAIGVAPVQAVRNGDEIFFVDSSRQVVRVFIFNQFEQSYHAQSIQNLYDEYPKTDPAPASTLTTIPAGARNIRQIAWDRSRSTLWCVDTAGNLFGCTRDKEAGVNAWHSHQMGGYDSTVNGTALTGGLVSGGSTTYDPAYLTPTGSVVSLAVVKNPVIGFDDVFLAVKRKVNGTWYYHIEKMVGGPVRRSSIYGLTVYSGHVFTDATSHADNGYPSTTATLSAGSQFEGMTPTAVAYSSYGLMKAQCGQVSGGNTTLLTPYPSRYTSEDMRVAFGYPFTHVIVPTRVDAGSQVGSSQGALKRIHRVIVRFYNTMAAKLGRDSSNVYPIDFQTFDQISSKSVELFTGDKIVDFNGDYDTDGLIYLEGDSPLPFCVTAIIAEGQTYD